MGEFEQLGLAEGNMELQGRRRLETIHVVIEAQHELFPAQPSCCDSITITDPGQCDLMGTQSFPVSTIDPEWPGLRSLL